MLLKHPTILDRIAVHTLLNKRNVASTSDLRSGTDGVEHHDEAASEGRYQAVCPPLIRV